MGLKGVKRGKYQKKHPTMQEIQDKRVQELKQPAPLKAEPSKPVETSIHNESADVEIYSAPPTESPTAPSAPTQPTTPPTPGLGTLGDKLSIQETLNRAETGTGIDIPPEEMEATRVLLEETLSALVNPGGLPFFLQTKEPMSPQLTRQWSVFASRILVRWLKHGIGDGMALVLSSGVIIATRTDWEVVLKWAKEKRESSKSEVDLEKELIAAREAENAQG
jgi:hypothetical protein